MRANRFFAFSYLYETHAGLKSINQLISSDQYIFYIKKKEERIDPNLLSMGFDGLNDSYTYLGSSLIESPHLEMMQFLSEGKDIISSVYITKLAAGSLDTRPACLVDQGYISMIEREFAERLKMIRSDSYRPVRVVNVNGSFFIEDGRHTAALCALLNIRPRCVEVSPLVYCDSFVMWIYKTMVKKPDSYSKHLTFFEKIFKTIYSGWN